MKQHTHTKGEKKILNEPRKFVKTLLELSVLNSFFAFNGKFYKQREGLGTGLPLGPTFVNIFMCFHESSCLADCSSTFDLFFIKDILMIPLCFLSIKSRQFLF